MKKKIALKMTKVWPGLLCCILPNAKSCWSLSGVSHTAIHLSHQLQLCIIGTVHLLARQEGEGVPVPRHSGRVHLSEAERLGAKKSSGGTRTMQESPGVTGQQPGLVYFSPQRVAESVELLRYGPKMSWARC